MKSLVFCLSLALAGLLRAQAPPATVTRTLTNGSTSLTVNFTLHPIRSANYNVQVQDASGNFTAYTADVPRTYIGTVTGRWTPNVYPTTGVGAGGAGSAVKAALVIDANTTAADAAYRAVASEDLDFSTGRVMTLHETTDLGGGACVPCGAMPRLPKRGGGWVESRLE